MKNEKQLLQALQKYFKNNPQSPIGTCAIELKLCKTPRLNLTHALQPQQLPALCQVRRSSLNYKISDFSPSLKPFDMIRLKDEPAYLAVAWLPKPRHHATLYFIPALILARIKTFAKSITEADAKYYAEYIIIL